MGLPRRRDRQGDTPAQQAERQAADPWCQVRGGWRRMAAISYKGDDELIDGVAAISAKAVTIKPERDRLIHCNLSEDLVIRIRRGEVVEILEIVRRPKSRTSLYFTTLAAWRAFSTIRFSALASS